MILINKHIMIEPDDNKYFIKPLNRSEDTETCKQSQAISKPTE